MLFEEVIKPSVEMLGFKIAALLFNINLYTPSHPNPINKDNTLNTTKYLCISISKGCICASDKYIVIA